VRLRLSALLFILYAVPGAVAPILSLRLAELGFTPGQIGWCCAAQALGALAAPFVAGQVADRWLPAQRCLAIYSLAAAALLWLLADLREPGVVFATLLAAWLLLSPAISLCASICFAHLRRPERDYGRVRLCGTLGWVVPGWLMALWLACPGWLAPAAEVLAPLGFRGNLGDSFRLGAVVAVLAAGYALTLPSTPPSPGGPPAPLVAFRRFRSSRPLAVLALCVLGMSVSQPFTSQTTPLLLADRGVPTAWLPLTLTLAQASEVLTLALLPWFLHRLGTAGTLRMGLAAWAAALCVLTLGPPVEVLIGSLALNGFCISCFYVTAQLHVNAHVPGDVRASSQAAITCLNGTGMLVGNLLAGGVRDLAGGRFPPTFAVAAGVALAVLVGFAVGFREERCESGEGAPASPGRQAGAPSLATPAPPATGPWSRRRPPGAATGRGCPSSPRPGSP